MRQLRRQAKQPEPLTYAARLLRRERQRRSRRRRRRVTGLAVLLAPFLIIAGTQLDRIGTRASPAELRPVAVVWGGDLAYDGQRPLPQDGLAGLAAIRDHLSDSDLAIINLEGTLGRGGTTKCLGESSGACFAFQAPPAFAEQLGKAGVDAVNLANNHSYDAGPEGLQTTLNALRRNDLGLGGVNGETGFVQAGSAKVAIAGFAAYPWSGDIRNLGEIRTQVVSASKKADHVIVMLHGGREGRDATSTPVGAETAFGEDRGDTRAAAHAAVDAGADLVVGSGPHVVRGLELYKKRLVAYSAGNLATNGALRLGGTYSVGALVRAKLGGDGRLLSGRVIPLRLNGPGQPSLDYEREAVKIMREAGREDFGDSAVRLTSSGRMIVRP